ncbi:MAG: serine/threonine protein kinase, partial [Planctomycetota bacterium]
VMADFGTATMHEVESQGGDPSLFVTAPGLVVGTVLYMAPEQLMCEPPDIRCDIYALATVMFEMLTLELPYDGADKRSLAYKYRKLSFEADLSPLEGKVPPKVSAAIGRALSRDPDDRFATPRAFHRALREAIHGTPREGSLPLRLLSGATLSRDPDQAETGRRSLAMARKRVRGWLEAAAAVSRGNGALARLKQTFLKGLAGAWRWMDRFLDRLAADPVRVLFLVLLLVLVLLAVSQLRTSSEILKELRRLS